MRTLIYTLAYDDGPNLVAPQAYLMLRSLREHGYRGDLAVATNSLELEARAAALDCEVSCAADMTPSSRAAKNLKMESFFPCLPRRPGDYEVVAFCDCDCVFMRDPTQYLMSARARLRFVEERQLSCLRQFGELPVPSRGSQNGINSGFWAAPGPAVPALLAAWRACARPGDPHDQPAFNRLVRGLGPATCPVPAGVLPHDQFVFPYRNRDLWAIRDATWAHMCGKRDPRLKLELQLAASASILARHLISEFAHAPAPDAAVQ